MLTTDDTQSEDLNTQVLSGGKRSQIASPKNAVNLTTLSDVDDIMQNREQREVMQLRENYKVRANRDHRICENQKERFGQIKQKIDKYQTEKNALPKDADGIYIIVSGMARISNPYDNYSFGDQKLTTGDYFGTSKYILSQGFSYFGDIIAHKEHIQKEHGQNLPVKSEKKRQLTNQMSMIS